MILYRGRRCNHTQRRQFIALLAGVAVAWPQSLIAQKKETSRPPRRSAWPYRRRCSPAPMKWSKDVRYWPLADIDLCSANVRFWMRNVWSGHGGCKQSPGLSFGTFMTRASSSLVKQNSLFLRANTLFLQNNCLFCCVGNFAASQ